MKKIFSLYFFILFYSPIPGYSQLINVSLLDDYSILALVISTVEGEYDIIADNLKVVSLKKSDIVYITFYNDSLVLLGRDQSFGSFKKISIEGKTNKNIFNIRSVSPSLPTRTYDDNIVLKSEHLRIGIINIVEFDKYIAGVVETELGPNGTMEYFKTQAILSRTYVLEYINNHKEESFFICDGVLCQAYKNRCEKNPLIYEASELTSGLVVTDIDSNLITAVFFSNCGGQTINSEDIWVSPKPYLKSVKDPFCIGQPHYLWEKRISKNRWIEYLSDNDIIVRDTSDRSLYYFDQLSRIPSFQYNNSLLSLEKIRTDLGLNSTFFSTQADGEDLVFKGKGYGHGVGLCQEGAKTMAERDYKFYEIIKFYYSNVIILDFNDIRNDKNLIFPLYTN